MSSLFLRPLLNWKPRMFWPEAPAPGISPTFLIYPEVVLTLSAEESGLVDLWGLPALTLQNVTFFLDAACRVGHTKQEGQPPGLGLTASGHSAKALVSFPLDPKHWLWAPSRSLPLLTLNLTTVTLKADTLINNRKTMCVRVRPESAQVKCLHPAVNLISLGNSAPENQHAFHQ